MLPFKSGHVVSLFYGNFPNFFLSWLSPLYQHLEQACSIHCLIFLSFLCEYYLISHFKMSENFEIRDYLIFFVIKPFPDSLLTEETHSDY